MQTICGEVKTMFFSKYLNNYHHLTCCLFRQKLTAPVCYLKRNATLLEKLLILIRYRNLISMPRRWRREVSLGLLKASSRCRISSLPVQGFVNRVQKSSEKQVFLKVQGTLWWCWLVFRYNTKDLYLVMSLNLIFLLFMKSSGFHVKSTWKV